MIGYLEGKLLSLEEERLLLLVNQVGYEILIPSVVLKGLSEKTAGDPIALYIYYQQTERQPKPVLIGFENASDKEFFQRFISVGDIGPLKALKALDRPVAEIAAAIESGNLSALTELKGIGKRTAQKIIAALAGKMEAFLVPDQSIQTPTAVVDDTVQQVLDVMVNQLGHKISEARKLIQEAVARQPDLSSPEALFDEIYRGSDKENA